jgi:hypothetical protein
MMNATTEATKLNFMTDHGSSRDSVSIAWRLFDRRTLTLGAEAVLALGPDPPRKADVTELASPAAAPPSPAAAPLSPAAAPAAVAEKPPVDGPLREPLLPGEAKPAESALTAAVGGSGVLDQDDRE